jgi:hypothetical protein
MITYKVREELVENQKKKKIGIKKLGFKSDVQGSHFVYTGVFAFV